MLNLAGSSSSNSNSYGGAGISVNSTTISREEFISCIENYRDDESYQTRFAQYAGTIYDICTSKGVNPVLCAAQAGQESGFGSHVPTNSPWNYWGLGVYNDQNTGIEFDSIEDAISYYCDLIIGYQQPGSIAYEMAQKYAPYNDKITGQMNSIYDIFCAYAYLGDYHNGSIGAGVKNVKDYLVNFMHYPCNHALTDPTTIEEQAAYAVDYIDNHILLMAKDIFGEDIVNSMTGGSIEDWDGEVYQSIQFTFPIYAQADSRWGSNSFGTNNIANGGCGATSLAMIVSGFTNQAYTPDKVVQILDTLYPSREYYVPTIGSSWEYFTNEKLIYGYFKCNARAVSEYKDAENALRNGEAVIVAIGRTNNTGHILAAVPTSASDTAAGNVFKILDPAGAGNGYDGVYPSFSKFKASFRNLASVSVVSIINRGENQPGSQKVVSATVVGKSGFIFPVQGLSVNNINNKNYPSYEGHTGVDINIGVNGGEKILAVKDGTVTKSEALKYDNGIYKSYGEYIEIEHADGTKTLYAHMMPNSRTVKKGDKVKQGQIIGKLGTTGNSSGNHLHFEVRVKDNPVNPLPYLGYGN